jgi:hypothetical protein
MCRHPELSCATNGDFTTNTIPKSVKGIRFRRQSRSRLGDRARREPFGATGEKARGESERRAGPEGEEDEHVAEGELRAFRQKTRDQGAGETQGGSCED